MGWGQRHKATPPACAHGDLLFRGNVSDVGGMQVGIVIHPDTTDYPEVGTSVAVYACRCDWCVEADQ